MANIREYIGARYVFKIYENSQNPASAEWESGVTYEPLTIVTYLNSTYASKKDVPGSVGNPADNPLYWVVTGAYNGQIAALQQQIDTINNTTIPALESDFAADISELEEKINTISSRKYIIISDSYGEQTNSWIDKLVANLGITSSDYFTSSVGGAGFAYGTTFEQQLTTLAGSITDKDSITDIIVGGGFNDRSVAAATVKTAIESFVTYAKTNFPNAKVHVGFISWSFNSEFISELVVNNVLNTYKQCVECGANYIDHSDEVMHDSTLFKQEDQSPYTLFLGYQYVHPSEAGAQAIANCVANYIKCGSGVSYDSAVTVTPTLSSGVSIGTGNFDLIMRKSGNNVRVGRKDYGLVTFNFTNVVNLNGQPIELGQLDSGLVAGVATTNANTKCLTLIPVLGFAVITNNVTFNGYLMIANNRVYLLAYLDGATSISTIALYSASSVFNTNEI